MTRSALITLAVACAVTSVGSIPWHGENTPAQVAYTAHTPVSCGVPLTTLEMSIDTNCADDTEYLKTSLNAATRLGKAMAGVLTTPLNDVIGPLFVKWFGTVGDASAQALRVASARDVFERIAKVNDNSFPHWDCGGPTIKPCKPSPETDNRQPLAFMHTRTPGRRPDLTKREEQPDFGGVCWNAWVTLAEKLMGALCTNPHAKVQDTVILHELSHGLGGTVDLPGVSDETAALKLAQDAANLPEDKGPLFSAYNFEHFVNDVYIARCCKKADDPVCKK